MARLHIVQVLCWQEGTWNHYKFPPVVLKICSCMRNHHKSDQKLKKDDNYKVHHERLHKMICQLR